MISKCYKLQNKEKRNEFKKDETNKQIMFVTTIVMVKFLRLLSDMSTSTMAYVYCVLSIVYVIM